MKYIIRILQIPFLVGFITFIFVGSVLFIPILYVCFGDNEVPDPPKNFKDILYKKLKSFKSKSVMKYLLIILVAAAFLTSCVVPQKVNSDYKCMGHCGDHHKSGKR